MLFSTPPRGDRFSCAPPYVEIVLAGLWGRRRDFPTHLRCFEPAPQAPFARVPSGDPSGLYATKLRYGGHAEDPVVVRNM